MIFQVSVTKIHGRGLKGSNRTRESNGIPYHTILYEGKDLDQYALRRLISWRRALSPVTELERSIFFNLIADDNERSWRNRLGGSCVADLIVDHTLLRVTILGVGKNFYKSESSSCAVDNHDRTALKNYVQFDLDSILQERSNTPYKMHSRRDAAVTTADKRRHLWLHLSTPISSIEWQNCHRQSWLTSDLDCIRLEPSNTRCCYVIVNNLLWIWSLLFINRLKAIKPVSCWHQWEVCNKQHYNTRRHLHYNRTKASIYRTSSYARTGRHRVLW